MGRARDGVGGRDGGGGRDGVGGVSMGEGGILSLCSGIADVIAMVFRMSIRSGMIPEVCLHIARHCPQWRATAWPSKWEVSACISTVSRPSIGGCLHGT